jgi:hypothetical protein
MDRVVVAGMAVERRRPSGRSESASNNFTTVTQINGYRIVKAADAGDSAEEAIH